MTGVAPQHRVKTGMTRLVPELYTLLGQRAHENYRSLSQEVAQRLLGSLSPDEQKRLHTIREECNK